MAPSPVVARWELSRRLAARRKELGVDVKTITGELGFTRNYWSAVENDRTLIAEDKLRRLFPLLDFSDQDQSELLQLREDSRKRGWWDEYSWLRDDHKRFYGMEAGASRIRAYDGHLVPGILQIEAYAHAVIEADPIFSPLEAANLTAVRSQRQQRFWASPGPSLLVLISEAVLRQQVAGPAIQVAQLDHLIRLAQDAEIRTDIRVLPFNINPGVIASSSTLLFFEYEDQNLPTVSWQEAVRSFDAIDDQDPQYGRLDLAWEDGIKRSLDSTESLRAISKVADELRD